MMQNSALYALLKFTLDTHKVTLRNNVQNQHARTDCTIKADSGSIRLFISQRLQVRVKTFPSSPGNTGVKTQKRSYPHQFVM